MARATRAGFWSDVKDLPLFLQACGAAALSMLLPAIHGFITREHDVGRAFFYSGILGFIVVTLIGVALMGRKTRTGALGSLLSLFGVMVLLPLFLAFPFYEGLRTTTFLNSYLEMVGAITTTGGLVFDDPSRLVGTLHLWRAQVGWMGGFVMWTAAASILAPLNLGGFEVTARAEPGRGTSAMNLMERADARTRLYRSAQTLGPVYVGLTVLLWTLLIILGDTPLVALSHAMSVLSTSGISPTGGVENASSGLAGEMLMALFMVFALSRLTFSTDTVTSGEQGLRRDPEVRLAAFILVVAPTVLFLRHWLGTLDVNEPRNVLDAFHALWGSVFTVMSFLSTTGFTSADWATAQDWSGLSTPSVILMGLTLIGGGVATTAGGVKLLRVYALYIHGRRELDRLVHPSSVSSARGLGRRLQAQGAYIAWIFFMLFALSLCAACLALTALGVGFEQAMILSVAGLSNTGPLIATAGDAPIRLIELSGGAQIVFAVTMIVGRLETLAIIALITPDLWRS